MQTTTSKDSNTKQPTGNTETNCDQLPTSFSSYDDAISAVKAATFKIQETLNTSKSSWIRGASYYSCDGITGYMIIETDEKEYLHQGVPISLWNQFKVAASFGSFYDHNFKHRYRFYLTQ